MEVGERSAPRIGVQKAQPNAGFIDDVSMEGQVERNDLVLGE